MSTINNANSSLQSSLSRRGFLRATASAGAVLAAGAIAPLDSAGFLQGKTALAEEKRTISVAFQPDRVPTSYLDDNNEPAGYEVEVVQAVAEKLADKYDYKWTGVDQTSIFAGLASGKYDQGLTNSFWTPQRAENYLQPEENVGATILGIVVRKENSDVRSLRDAAERGLSLSPILAGDGNYYVAEDYNEQNPDAPLDLQATDDTNAFNEAFEWVAQGRYDLHLAPLQFYNGLVVTEDGVYHKYIDDLAFIIIGATKTWSFFKQGNEDYAADWDAAIKELKSEGKLEELSRKWYSDINNFAFITDDTKTYNYLDEGILVDPNDESELTTYGEDASEESATSDASVSDDASTSKGTNA